jgi:hypothetical protein
MMTLMAMTMTMMTVAAAVVEAGRTTTNNNNNNITQAVFHTQYRMFMSNPASLNVFNIAFSAVAYT